MYQTCIRTTHPPPHDSSLSSHSTYAVLLLPRRAEVYLWGLERIRPAASSLSSPVLSLPSPSSTLGKGVTQNNSISVQYTGKWHHMISCNGQYWSRPSVTRYTLKIFKQHRTGDMYYANTTITKGTVRTYPKQSNIGTTAVFTLYFWINRNYQRGQTCVG